MNDCCLDAENRGPTEQITDDLSFTRCSVCGRRHFELDLDVAELSFEGKET